MCATTLGREHFLGRAPDVLRPPLSFPTNPSMWPLRMWFNGQHGGLTAGLDDLASPSFFSLNVMRVLQGQGCHGAYVAVGRADQGFPVGDHAPGRDADGHHVLLGAAADGVVPHHLPNVLHQPVVCAPRENPGSWNNTQSPRETQLNTPPPMALKTEPKPLL